MNACTGVGTPCCVFGILTWFVSSYGVCAHLVCVCPPTRMPCACTSTHAKARAHTWTRGEMCAEREGGRGKREEGKGGERGAKDLLAAEALERTAHFPDLRRSSAHCLAAVTRGAQGQ